MIRVLGSAENGPLGPLAGKIIGALMLLAFIGVGLAASMDFRGCTTRHVHRTDKKMSWFFGPSKPESIRRQINFERIGGAIFVVVGLATLIAFLLAPEPGTP